MRVLGRVFIGVGVVAAGYLCVDMFSETKPKKPATHRVPDDVTPENTKVAEVREPVQVQVDAVQEERPTKSAPTEALPAEHPPPDRSEELHATLEAEYSSDTIPTRGSLERERVISQL